MEKKLIKPWFSRFNTVNKGILRILAIILVGGAFYCSIMGGNAGSNTDYQFLIGITFGGAFYFGTVLSFRLILWIIDGFKDNKTAKE
ncbi:hypothetical protein [Adhaeribacter aquaticus]|uniref:hypothetical protein n=1 Tax=Adhaeribacter aquaticus TaxID=299567 RepID=UPI0003FFED74|nr:hypothetical protein [Adhaeribacter aquaticus]